MEAISLERLRHEKLPNGSVRHVELLTVGEGVHVRLEIETLTGGVRPFQFDTPFIAAALMRYCMRAGIPLPRRSTKRLTVDGDCVLLCLELKAHPVETEPVWVEQR